MLARGQTFIANLGDIDPVNYGGLFLYRDDDGSFSLEKLEEPVDHCEICENEPEDPDSAQALLRWRYPGEYVVVTPDCAHVLAHHADYSEAWDLAKVYVRYHGDWLDLAFGLRVINPRDSVCATVACEQAINLFNSTTQLTPGSAEHTAAVASITAAFAPVVETEAFLRKAYAKWQAHVAAHEQWMVYQVDLERFKVVREYEIRDCRCVVDAKEDDQEFWQVHARVCPDRKVTRYLIDAAYEESWREYGTPAQREPWFYDGLDRVADSVGTSRLALIKALCSSDGKKLAWAWECILDYHGWENGDSYPLRLTLPEVERRYEAELFGSGNEE